MIYIKPDFFDKFKCIASKCTDSCCIGWEIDVDVETFKKYKTAQTPFFEKVLSKITESPDGGKCIELGENERCPFLDKNNLCEIISTCGENAVCEICREHPRFYEWFPGVTECGLGLCCEEVCRILLENRDFFELTELNDGEKAELHGKEETVVSDTYIFLSAFREKLFDCLKNGDYSFTEKLELIKTATENFSGEKITPETDAELLLSYKNTEPFNDAQTEYLQELYNNYRNYTSLEMRFDEETNGDMFYSKITAYIIYRHFIKAVFDGEISKRIAFCINSIRFIKICDMKTFYEKGTLVLADRIENLKNWSKQIEYSDFNTDYLIFGE